MFYPYRCPKCENLFEIIKSVADIDREEFCEKCGTISERYISRTHFFGASDWHGDEFNPGLGCVVKNNQHKKQILKARGLEEIGSEPTENIHSFSEKRIKEKAEQREQQAREESAAWLNS